MKAILAPIYFPATNVRERGEFQDQMKVLKEMYGDVAEFLEPVAAGETVSAEADAIVFPQMIFEAFRILIFLSQLSIWNTYVFSYPNRVMHTFYVCISNSQIFR